MSEATVELERFQEYLNAPGISLNTLRASTPANLFPSNYGFIPPFFQENLTSPNRILKLLERSPHSNIKIFYYQLLRVSYEVETEAGFNNSFMYNFIHIVFHPQFEVFFTQDSQDQRDLFNDFTFKKLFAEFITMVQNDESPNIENILNNYPIMDTVFVHIIRSIMVSQGDDHAFESKIPTSTLFSEMSNLTSITIESFNNNCWKFVDSDMFCYEYDEDRLYLAFILEPTVISDEPSSGPLSGSYESYNTSNKYNEVKPIGGYQSLDNMATRYVSVEPRIEETITLQAPKWQTNRNEVKESMISVTYEFVDFTGDTTAYKDKVPKSMANATSSLAQQKRNPSTFGPGHLDSLAPSEVISRQQTSFNRSGFDTILGNQNGSVFDNLRNGTANLSKPSTGLDKPGSSGSYQSMSAFSEGFNYGGPLVTLANQNTYSYQQSSSYSSYNPKNDILSDFKQTETKYEAPKYDLPKYDLPTYEAPKFELPKYEVPKYEVPKYEVLKNEAPRFEQSQTFTASGDLGDYYNDFTSDNLLNSVAEPHRSKVIQIKSRIRGWKKSGIFGMGGPLGQIRS